VGGNVQATELLNKVQPVYPESGLEKGLEGTVLLRAVIGTDGKLLSLGAVSATKAALNAVQLWTYEPTLLNGQPVEIVTTISVTFRLQ
jgi:protein TonB